MPQVGAKVNVAPVGGSGAQGALTGDVTAAAGSGSRPTTLVATTAVKSIIATWSAVTSVFGRTGAVTAQSGDYNATQVPNVVVTVTQSATPAIDTDNGTVFEILNLAQNVTSLTSGLTGTPVDGQEMITRYSDNGTARTITPGASFVQFPTLSTTPGQDLDVKWMYSSALTAWVFQYQNVTALTNASGQLGSPVALTAANTTYPVLSTASLAVGVWLLTVTASMHDSGGSGGVCEVEVVPGTATATFSGPVAAGNSPYYNQASVSFTCVVTVTVAGTLTIQGRSNNTGQLVANVSETFGTNATGYSAIKIG